MGFPRQEYRRELPFPSPEDLPKSGIKPTSPALAGEFFTAESPGKPLLLFKSPSSQDFVTAALRDEYTDLSQEDEKELSKQAPVVKPGEHLFQGEWPGNF